MNSFVSLFGTVSVPILLACFLGYLYQQYKSPDTKVLADLSLFVLAPCLIVSAVSGSGLNSSAFAHIALFTMIQTILCWGAALVVGKLFRFDTP